MRRTSLLALFLLALAVTNFAHALKISGRAVVIPVIGRFPGDGGTLWRTDVFLLNPYSPSANVTLKFYSNSGLRQFSATLPGYQTLTLRDIVLNTYGLEGAGGVLEIESTSDIEARARVYNVGSPAGEFGQAVPGIEKERLALITQLHGFVGTGTRLNVGVTNPNDTDVSVRMFIFDRFHTVLRDETFTVAKHSYAQFNNIFPLYNIPVQEGVWVEFSTFDAEIYGFASEVRTDTGDAVFIFGTNRTDV